MLKIRLIHILFTFLFLFAGAEFSIAQTNPTPWDLTAGSYIFTTWVNTNAAGTYPPNSYFHRTSTLHPPKLAPTTGNYSNSYNNTTPIVNSARIDGAGPSGFDFVNDITNGDHNIGAWVVGINSTGRTNIRVSWTGRGVSAGSLYNVMLQYRISPSSPWIDTGSEFVGTGGLTASTPLGPINLSTLTGGAVDNRANMQLRWKYYWVSGVASLSKIRVSAVTVASDPLVGNYTSTDIVNSTPYCVTSAVGANITIPFKYEPRLNFPAGTTFFTAQLSNAAGSFAAPVSMGSTVSNASGSQNFIATIPPNTPYGTGYRIRVISFPVISDSSNDNIIDITVKLSPTDVTSPLVTCASEASNVSWVLPSISCYDEVMVVASASSSVTGTPSGNGGAYTASATFGSGTPFGNGFVVYKSAGASVPVTNLTNGTNYYFKIWVRYGSNWSTGVEVNCTPDYQTKVLINEYLNAADPLLEWTELITTVDDLDMRNFQIRDNNSSQTGWQPSVNFNNMSFWQHIRKGTVIVLYHRQNSHTIDVDPSDGYLQMELFDPIYFNGGDLGNTMNLALPGDIVEILTQAYVHIHGVGHFPSPGALWTLMPTPKLNYAGGMVDGESISVCPGGTINDYDGVAGTNVTKSGVPTLGLPNTCVGTTNADFWNTLRQPYMSPQTVFFSSIIAGSPGTVSFSWLPATDPYPSDNSTGYIVLRNTTNSFPVTPADGSTYLLGANLGGATVMANITGSATTNFIDNTVMNGSTYYYRVYAYRYNPDNLNGDNYNASRGRAYNGTNFVSVNWPSSSPLPVNLLTFKGEAQENKIHLTWSTSTEKYNDYFLIEKSADGVNFTTLGKVKGAGNSVAIQQYMLDDLEPITGFNYYALTQFDFNGDHSVRKIIAVKYNRKQSINATCYPNPFTGDFHIECFSTRSGNIQLNLFDCIGKLVQKEVKAVYDGTNHFMISTPTLDPGTYFLELKNDFGESYHSRIIKK